MIKQSFNPQIDRFTYNSTILTVPASKQPENHN